MRFTFGRSVVPHERRRVEAGVAAAADVLASVLGAPTEAIALGATLTVSVGERHGGLRGDVVYVGRTAQIVIRRRVAGPGLPFAHEWAHAFEDHLRKRNEWEPLGYVVDRLKFSPWTPEFAVARAEEIAKDDVAAARRYCRGDWQWDLPSKRWGASFYLADAEVLADDDGLDYWDDDAELLARSFEAWVYDRAGGSVPYLVDERSAPRARQGGVPDAYPQGHCRARSCALWDELTRCLDWESDGPTVRRGPARDWRYFSRRDAIQLALNAMGVSGCEHA